METPTETVLRLIYPVNMFCRGRVVILTEDSLRKMLLWATVIELVIFAVLVEKRHRETGASPTQLAEYTGAEPDLIGIFYTPWASGVNRLIL